MNHGEIIVLSLLAQRSCHGYELRTILDEMNIHQWARLGGSTVYPILRRLMRDGQLRRGVESQENRPDRHVYSVTPEGRRRLESLIVEALESGEGMYSDRAVGGIFAVTHEERDRMLPHVQAAIENRHRALERLDERRMSADPLGRKVIRFYERLTAAEIALLEELAEEPAPEPVKYGATSGE